MPTRGPKTPRLKSAQCGRALRRGAPRNGRQQIRIESRGRERHPDETREVVDCGRGRPPEAPSGRQRSNGGKRSGAAAARARPIPAAGQPRPWPPVRKRKRPRERPAARAPTQRTGGATAAGADRLTTVDLQLVDKFTTCSPGTCWTGWSRSCNAAGPSGPGDDPDPVGDRIPTGRGRFRPRFTRPPQGPGGTDWIVWVDRRRTDESGEVGSRKLVTPRRTAGDLERRPPTRRQGHSAHTGPTQSPRLHSGKSSSTILVFFLLWCFRDPGRGSRRPASSSSPLSGFAQGDG